MAYEQEKFTLMWQRTARPSGSGPLVARVGGVSVRPDSDAEYATMANEYFDHIDSEYRAAYLRTGINASLLAVEAVTLSSSLGGAARTAVRTGTTAEANSRLTARLSAWRSYKEGGGAMSMSRWVQATQRQYGGVSGGYKTGYAAWDAAIGRVHGNSALSPRTAYLYALEDQAGNFLKWGVTQDLQRRYSASFMLDKRIYKVLEGNRAEMLRMERELIETRPGPLNAQPWAGSRMP